MSKTQARIAVALENVVMQLRRRNDMTEAFYREALDVLSAAKDGDGSPVGSGQPEASLRCEVCGKAGHVSRCLIGPLTREQWKAHYASYYQHRMNHGGYKIEANRAAADMMRDRFGPCPEES